LNSGVSLDRCRSFASTHCSQNRRLATLPRQVHPAALGATLPEFVQRKTLDLGCGTGWVLAESHLYGTGCLLVGADMSTEQLRQGHQKFPGIHFVKADGTALPFPDECFDEVIGHVSLPYMNTVTALREVHRVLRPGGLFFLTFHSLHYVVERLKLSLREGKLKDLFFLPYIAANGVLNACGLPQLPAWSRGRFETFNSAAGVIRTARKIGFTSFSSEQEEVFFSVSGRKAGPEPNEAPGWSLASVVRR